MARRCCCGVCAVFGDDFTDAASSTLSANWEEAGSDTPGAEYDGTTHLEISGTALDRAICIDETRTRKQKVGCGITDMVVGEKYQVYFNMLNATNGHIVEVVRGTPDIIRWYKMTGGALGVALREEEIQSGSLGLETEISICSNDDSITVSFSPQMPGEFFYHPNPSLYTNGKRAGVGNGGANKIRFDSFDVSNYHGNDGYNGYLCCSKECQCVDETGTHAIPHTLEATIYAPRYSPEDDNGCRDKLDGHVMDLVYYTETDGWVSYDNAAKEFYDGSTPQGDANLADPPDQPHPICNDDSWWVMACGEATFCGDAVADATFTLVNGVGPGGGACVAFSECIDYNNGETSYVCSPFEVVFPLEGYSGYEVSPLCPCCNDELPGFIYVIVTEK